MRGKVLLVPAVGSSVFYTMSRLVDHPKALHATGSKNLLARCLLSRLNGAQTP